LNASESRRSWQVGHIVIYNFRTLLWIAIPWWNQRNHASSVIRMDENVTILPLHMFWDRQQFSTEI